MKEFEILIDGKKCVAKEGESILVVSKRCGIDIPALCYHCDVEPSMSCRLCLVEIKGEDKFRTSCSTKAKPGMDIITYSNELERTRKINLELLFAEHAEKCADCIAINHCELLELAKKYKIDFGRFLKRKRHKMYQFGPSIVFDQSKCINCQNCVRVCEKQNVNYLEMKTHRYFAEITPSERRDRDCVYCGQCVTHCPVGALEAVGEFGPFEDPTQLKGKKLIFQFAPSIRTSIGEEFGLPVGQNVIGKLVAALRKLGAYMVFDTATGADFTTIEEAGELADKLAKGESKTLFSSCCPAWVKFVEFNYPEFIPNLATTRSPQTILGGLIKTYFAKKAGIKAKDIYIVSIMPCTAKKFEIERRELWLDGMRVVDLVLTTRELARLLKKKEINLANLEDEKLDDVFDESSGAGVIYGASGGVMESALRTAYEKITGKKLDKVEFGKVRGQEGKKIAEVDFGGRKIRVAAVSGLQNAKAILEEVKADPEKYSCIEVMACPGGCINGGGQPTPTSPEIRKARADGLYKSDSVKTLRLAHENPVVKQIYKEFLDDNKNRQAVCHTHFLKKSKGKTKRIG